MTKIKFVRIVLVVLSVMILIGVIFTIYMLATVKDRHILNIRLNDDATQVVGFQDLCLMPGEKSEYTLSLVSDKADPYRIELTFHETVENPLKNYVRIQMVANGEIVCDQLLATLMDNQTITLRVDLREEQKNDIKIIYYLPEEVGNEAQNAEASFELQIKASKE